MYPLFCPAAHRFPNSISESLSAFRASSLEYLSAVSSSHSLSEAVLDLSLALLRLISSKHLDTSLSYKHYYIKITGFYPLYLFWAEYPHFEIYTITLTIIHNYPPFVNPFFKFSPGTHLEAESGVCLCADVS